MNIRRDLAAPRGGHLAVGSLATVASDIDVDALTADVTDILPRSDARVEWEIRREGKCIVAEIVAIDRSDVRKIALELWQQGAVTPESQHVESELSARPSLRDRWRRFSGNVGRALR